MSSSVDLARRVAELEAENRRLRQMLASEERSGPPALPSWEPTLLPPAPNEPRSAVTRHSSPAEKVAVFRTLFQGRDDVYASRWANDRTGKLGWSPAVHGGPANARKPDRQYLPLSDEVVANHLAGRIHAGLYPLRLDDCCRLLACDFDGPGWVLDGLAYLDAARSAGVPTALERSRSGAGGHVWVFFSGPVPANVARRIGVFLVREAMTVRAELDLTSYDRLFPAQDFLPRQGFGNLIAMPLQGECRRRDTTVFVDPATLEPFGDQWEFLSSIEQMSVQSAASMAESVGELAVGPLGSTYRRPTCARDDPPAPDPIKGSATATLSIDTVALPPALLSAMKHAASLPNPEFYEKERTRFWTGKTPRLIRCYRESLGALHLPRGLRAQVEAIAAEAGSRLAVTDHFPEVETTSFDLAVTLRPDQAAAVDTLAADDIGVLVAPPGAGKTVMACALIARYRVPTMVIVDRQPLVDQWGQRLTEHLALGRKQVGQIGGQRKASGVVDIAMAQSLARREDLDEITSKYGLVVVDECHHVPAVTFERAVRQIPVRRWVGLTATPYRRDRLESMMNMYCGPVRHRMAQGEAAQLLHRQVVIHQTPHLSIPGEHFQEILRGVVSDDRRTAAICNDIAAAAAEGRNSLIPTRWTEHLDTIVAQLAHHEVTPLILRGGMGKKARRAVLDALNDAGLRGAVLVATSGLIGEGFDCPGLDTVFLAFPIKFKGSIVQYVGRILRPAPGKTDVIVHDYVDVLSPVLARMYLQRAHGYAALGFHAPRWPSRRN